MKKDIPLIEFLELISDFNTIKRHSILIDYKDEVVGTIEQLKDVSSKMDYTPLNKLIHEIEQNAINSYLDIEVYNYLKDLTNDFNEDESKLALREMIVFRDMELHEEMNHLAEIEYHKNKWELPTYEKKPIKGLKHFAGSTTFRDYSIMRNRAFPFLGHSLYYAIRLLESKLKLNTKKQVNNFDKKTIEDVREHFKKILSPELLDKFIQYAFVDCKPPKVKLPIQLSGKVGTVFYLYYNSQPIKYGKKEKYLSLLTDYFEVEYSKAKAHFRD